MREHLSNITDHEVLISCDEQTSGIGRTNNKWDFYPQSLAMSFLISPNSIPTITPLEIGIIIILFFKEQFNIDIKLKWPNDLMTDDSKKTGGIICHYIDQNKIIVGLGINFTLPTNTYSYNSACLTLPIQQDLKELSLKIYQYILSHRIPKNLPEIFNKYCIHLNQHVSMVLEEQTFLGEFIGITNHGEAILKINGENKTFLAGSLLLN